MHLSNAVLARAAGHTVVRVLALLGVERLLMGTHLDGVLRTVGLYSDDPVGAGLTAFLMVVVVAGVLGVADGLLRRRTTSTGLQLAVWAVVAALYGAASASLGDWTGVGEWVFGAVLMGGLAAAGGLTGVAVGTALRLAVTPAATPGRPT
ncbi:hypothetical protein [Solicola sp. PLA-1-18]|uniref:hypothetical protein n=1 Tax=Solicola sp. PLA-1-18 TaxID=3380532 RepID=UPI003B807A3F